MSSTAQRVRGSAKQSQTIGNLSHQSNWSGIFPNKVDTTQKSVTFVKKLLSVSLSNITYIRSMFSEDAYAKKSLSGMPIQILREKSGNEEAETLSQWLIGAFEAIELKYLKDLVFFVYIDKDKPEEVYEKYTFHFNYHGGEARFELEVEDSAKKESVTMSNIQDTTRSLLRSIVVLTQALKPLPPSAHLAMKLSYYENCPDDYEPKGFAATTLVENPMPCGSYSTRLGRVDTRHHGLQLRMETRQDQVQEEGPELVSNTFRASQQSVTASQNPSQPGPVGKVDVDCVCGNTTVDQLMLRCEGCQTKQHGACYRVVSEESKPAVHTCVSCSQKDSRPCTDPKLVTMLEKSGPGIVATTCLYRRIILFLREVETTSLKFLMGKFGLDSLVAQKIFAKLSKDAVVGNEGVGGTYAVIKEQIEAKYMKKYFGIKPTDNLGSLGNKMTDNLVLEEGKARRSKLKRSRNGSGDGEAAAESCHEVTEDGDKDNTRAVKSPRDERLSSLRKRVKKSASKTSILSSQYNG